MVDEWHLLPGPADITKLDRIINKLAGKGKSEIQSLYFQISAICSSAVLYCKSLIIPILSAMIRLSRKLGLHLAVLVVLI